MNLILLTVDCLRADRLSCMGYSKITTPHIDSLARSGLLFKQAITLSSWTPSSFMALFTSSYPLMQKGKLGIPGKLRTIPELVKTGGYNTAGFHSNPWLAAKFGYSRGFDIFDDSLQENLEHEPYGRAETLHYKALNYIKDLAGDFFLWLHYMDMHEPYLPVRQSTANEQVQFLTKLNRRAFAEQQKITHDEARILLELYDEKILYLDQEIGRFLAQLDELHIRNSTTFIVTADHGQMFNDHGLFGHGTQLYEELIHVPLIITGPGIRKQCVKRVVSMIDLAPTILDILGVDAPTTFLGSSLLPSIKKYYFIPPLWEALSETDSIDKYARQSDPELDVSKRQISVRTDKWKYIYTEGQEGELYYLKDDYGEAVNLIRRRPDIAAKLCSRIMAHITFEEIVTEEETEEGQAFTMEDEEKVKQRLRSLGYLK